MPEKTDGPRYHAGSFEYPKPTGKQVAAITTVREGCKALSLILFALPNSRERSLAITKLEEVSMWANKGIVFTPDDQFSE